MKWCFFGGLMAGLISGIALKQIDTDKRMTSLQIERQAKADQTSSRSLMKASER